MRPSFLAIVMFVIAVFYGNAAKADFQNGNSLLKHCITDHLFSQGYCLGFIAGVADVMLTNPIYGFRACVPERVVLGQVVDVVVNNLKNSPEKRHFTAHSLVASYLSQAFPCK